tara:strand:- start:3384 stop:3674 length:291 start_codon:yes stop_codon:yes gene_type:complete
MRYHCEFKNCSCDKYIKLINDVCTSCNHGKVWHARHSKPPSDAYLQFYSPRKSARKPTYQKIPVVEILHPVIYINESKLNNYIFDKLCPTVEALPV